MVKKLINRLFGRDKTETNKVENKAAVKADSTASIKTVRQKKSPANVEKKEWQPSGSENRRPARQSKGNSEHARHTRAPSKTKQLQEAHQNWSVDQFVVPEEEGKQRFHEFDLPETVMHAIHDLGFQYCTPIQAKVLGHAGQGRDIAGRAQTGTGKTAAFLISILAEFYKKGDLQEKRKPGTPRALVLAPTRELVMQIIKDTKDISKYCAFRSMAVYGGIDFEKQKSQLLQYPVDLVAATPGRLLDYARRNVLDLKQIEVLVIDEADRMLDMGFIPDVSRIVRLTPPKSNRQTLLFSATLTDNVLQLASKWMTDPVFCEMAPEQVTVDTVEQLVYITTGREKFHLLCNLMTQINMDHVLIFGNRREATRRLTERLNRAGFKAAYLSGAVPQNKRQRILEDFRSGKCKILVATDVAGRGLHVDNISHVINYEFPYEAEDYVHRIGRTGRAGVKGTAISFACENESFVIPDIEEYIGQPLPCSMPADELVKPFTGKPSPQHRK